VCVLLIPQCKQLVANIDIALRKPLNLRKTYTNQVINFSFMHVHVHTKSLNSSTHTRSSPQFQWTPIVSI
jgi:hypothetical protein